MATIIAKRENVLKALLMAHATKEFFYILHQQVRGSGIPDVSLHGYGKSSWWEIKHATPDFESPGIQEYVCCQLNLRSFCRYIIFCEAPDVKRVVITAPDKVLGYKGRMMQIEPDLVFEGHDFVATMQYMQSIHR